MGFFKRVRNLIRSNINFKNEGASYEFSDDFLHENLNQFTPKINFKNDIEKEYYANLELPYGASFSEIKTAYRKLLKKYHPDKFYNDEKKLQLAQEVVIKLNLAYNYFENKFTGS